MVYESCVFEDYIKIVVLKMSEVFIDLQSFAYTYLYFAFVYLKSMKTLKKSKHTIR